MGIFPHASHTTEYIGKKKVVVKILLKVKYSPGKPVCIPSIGQFKLNLVVCTSFVGVLADWRPSYLVLQTP